MALIGLGALALYALLFVAVIYFWQRMWHTLEQPESPSMPIALTMVILTLVIVICGLLAKLEFITSTS